MLILAETRPALQGLVAYPFSGLGALPVTGHNCWTSSVLFAGHCGFLSLPPDHPKSLWTT